MSGIPGLSHKTGNFVSEKNTGRWAFGAVLMGCSGECRGEPKSHVHSTRKPAPNVQTVAAEPRRLGVAAPAERHVFGGVFCRRMPFRDFGNDAGFGIITKINRTRGGFPELLDGRSPGSFRPGERPDERKAG